MPAAATNRNNFPYWKLALASLILEKGKFPDGETTEKLKEFADEHDANFSTVRTTYYKYQTEIPTEVKEALAAAQNEDPNVHNAVLVNREEGINQAEEPHDSIADVYPEKSIIEVEVTHVLAHGAVVVTKDANRQEGFIYVGDIAKKWVNNVHKYFKPGDTTWAMVKNYDAQKKQIMLSTRNLPSSAKKEQETTTIRTSVTAESPQPAKEAPIPTDTGVSLASPDVNDLRGFVKGVIGYDPSAAAVDKFLSLFTTHGVFKTSIAMAKVSETFEVDLGLLLAERVGAALKSEFPS
ncbi:hypothetical protein [Paenibacillus sp. 1P03SA]|uniref:hypothetical protein n=1 Tax=Paenibacillus sp. 1P03SA TaxID=3132294 RepID=UPI0039A0B448